MVDLHCHILPGLDDGPPDIDESLEMAAAAIAEGITHVVATPHSNSRYFFDYPKIRALCRELQDKVGDQLKLATGCDFHLNPENLEALRSHAPRFCVNQKNYLLVEFNEIAIPPVMDQTLHEMQIAGVRPIITHPERNRILRVKPERLTKWAQLGCYGQITAGSLTGRFGESAQQSARQWIGAGLVHFVCSDAHNTSSRPLQLRPAYDLVAKEFGAEKARALFTDNPMAAFDGCELPHVPELEDERVQPQKKRFLFF
ncbi:MAG: exopolysaccharide biosynthesis protein [Acidobacteriota bacterium]|nr:exopolysaccharide biosynthesis protein [Acidobacteriota bacterium]